MSPALEGIKGREDGPMVVPKNTPKIWNISSVAEK